MDEQITIRMPHADREMVLAVLRDPANQNKQGTGRLFSNKGYCCLGIAQCAKTGGFVERYGDTSKEFRGCPSKRWLSKVGWEFKNHSDYFGNDPYFPSVGYSATAANDTYMLTFAQIADLWEKHSEGY